MMRILPVSCTGVDRKSFLVEGAAGQIVMLLFLLRISNLPVQPVKVQPFLTATTSASFLQSSNYKGAGWIQIRWKYWPSSFPLCYYSMNGINYIAILQADSTGQFCFWFFMAQARFLKSTTAATVVGGPKTFGRTKKLEDQKTKFMGPNNLGDKQNSRSRKRTKNWIFIFNWIRVFWLSYGGVKKQNTHFWCFLKMSKFTCFLGEPNEPKICGRRTNTDFKDRGTKLS